MKHQNIVGREKEVEILERVYNSKKSEFLAVYGRRRVGKTHLIRQYFSKKGIFLETSGIKDAPLHKQLKNFSESLSKTFFGGVPLQIPDSWDTAFELMTREVTRVSQSKKIILFLDELPWMATKKSGLLQSIDHFWNQHWSKFPNLILIVCGSAASWMLEKLVYAKGGLHNRLTRKILLEPFNLHDTREFLKSRSIKLNEKQILDIYMAIGGIPFYLQAIEKGMSAAQCIDEMCFQKNGLLYDEFKNLFESLFEMADINLQIVREIVKNGNECSREDIIKRTDLKTGGTLNKRLNELEVSGFIKKFIPYGKKTRNSYFKVIDEFSLFFLKWIEPYITSDLGAGKKGYWENLVKSPSVSTWYGLAFETVCFKHIEQIKRKLLIQNLACKTGAWRYIPPKKSEKSGAQIDLLFDRADGIITICEIKYSESVFKIDKRYAMDLCRKIEVFQDETKTQKQVFLSFITTMGISQNAWYDELVENSVTVKDLFD